MRQVIIHYSGSVSKISRVVIIIVYRKWKIGVGEMIKSLHKSVGDGIVV